MTTLNSDWTIIAQGAEGKLYKGTWQGLPCLVKERISKSYRNPILDKNIRTKRLSQEVRSIVRCRKAGVRTPTVYFVDPETCCIYMEYITGITLKEFIMTHTNDEEVLSLCRQVGEIISKLHDTNLVHGDLTTSNFIVEDKTKNLVLIDFGLTVTSSSHEDKGVDLYVLERAFSSTHPKSDLYFQMILETYKQSNMKSNEVLLQFEKVRARGRKRIAFG